MISCDANAFEIVRKGERETVFVGYSPCGSEEHFCVTACGGCVGAKCLVAVKDKISGL